MRDSRLKRQTSETESSVVPSIDGQDTSDHISNPDNGKTDLGVTSISASQEDENDEHQSNGLEDPNTPLIDNSNDKTKVDTLFEPEKSKVDSGDNLLDTESDISEVNADEDFKGDPGIVSTVGDGGDDEKSSSEVSLPSDVQDTSEENLNGNILPDNKEVQDSNEIGIDPAVNAVENKEDNTNGIENTEKVEDKSEANLENIPENKSEANLGNIPENDIDKENLSESESKLEENAENDNDKEKSPDSESKLKADDENIPENDIDNGDLPESESLSQPEENTNFENSQDAVTADKDYNSPKNYEQNSGTVSPTPVVLPTESPPDENIDNTEVPHTNNEDDDPSPTPGISISPETVSDESKEDDPSDDDNPYSSTDRVITIRSTTENGMPSPTQQELLTQSMIRQFMTQQATGRPHSPLYYQITTKDGDIRNIPLTTIFPNSKIPQYSTKIPEIYTSSVQNQPAIESEILSEIVTSTENYQGVTSESVNSVESTTPMGVTKSPTTESGTTQDQITHIPTTAQIPTTTEDTVDSDFEETTQNAPIDSPTTSFTSETTSESIIIIPHNTVTEKPLEEGESTGAEVVTHHRKRPNLVLTGREGETIHPDISEEGKNEEPATTTISILEVSSSSMNETESEPNDDILKTVEKAARDAVKKYGAFKVSLILLAVIFVTFISIFCCCKLCGRKAYKMRQRKLREFGQEKEFLLRDRKKNDRYSNDAVTLLDGSSEDEF